MFLIIYVCFTLHANALNAEQVYSKVNDSIFLLYSVDLKSKTAKARGSAVAVAPGLVATNCHIIISGNYLVIKVHRKMYLAHIVYKDNNQDFCLLKVPGAHFKSVKIRLSNNVKIGESVYAVGNPKGLEKSLSRGIISNRLRVKGGIWLQTDATIYFGSSGGGLFDSNGELIGLTSKMSGNFGFAIPTEWILNILEIDKNGNAHLAKKLQSANNILLLQTLKPD